MYKYAAYQLATTHTGATHLTKAKQTTRTPHSPRNREYLHAHARILGNPSNTKRDENKKNENKKTTARITGSRIPSEDR
jgi:hypothetical protein